MSDLMNQILHPVQVCPGCSMVFPVYAWHQCPTHRVGPASEEARLRARVRTLEARLARVLRLTQESGYGLWTARGFGRAVYSRDPRRFNRAGVWSKRHSPKGGGVR